MDESPWNATFDSSFSMALRALAFVKSAQPIWRRFQSDAGLSCLDGRDRAPRPHELVALLDFLIADERTLRAFSRRVELPPEAAYEARRILGRAPRREGSR